MLIQFSVKNFKTFRDKVTLNLLASNYDKVAHEQTNVVQLQDMKIRLLKTAIVYWANASGKSKLFESIYFMKKFVINSANNMKKGDLIDIDTFKLDDFSTNNPSEFEIRFIYQNKFFRYGFELNAEKIISEWLYCRPKTKEIEIFYRDESGLSFHKKFFSKGEYIEKERVVRDNILVLSYAVQVLNTEWILWEAFDWFANQCKFADGLSEGSHGKYTQKCLHEDSGLKQKIIEMLLNADFNITNLNIEEVDMEEKLAKMPSGLQDLMKNAMKELGDKKFYWDTFVTHKKFDIDWAQIGEITFSMDDEESSWTKKFFSLTGPILDAISTWKILFVDELEAKLHPNLVNKIVWIFNSKEFNPKNAQLIATTHNTNLLTPELLRRDQIWFVEKDRQGVASLYSLSDFSVQKTENFEINYINGKYGAVPFLGNFDFAIS